MRRRPAADSEIDVAASHAERLVAEWGPDAPEDSLAKTVARGLHGTTPLIAGAGLTAPMAYRWKTQINENAKIPAFAHELPELDHNEIVRLGGRATRSGASRPCSSTTPTCTRGSGSGSS